MNERKIDAAKEILNAIPCPIFLADKGGRILFGNKAAKEFTGDGDLETKPLCGYVVRCIHAIHSPDDCGTTPFCPTCGVRAALNSAYAGKPVVRERCKMHVMGEDGQVDLHLLVSASRFDETEAIILTLEDIGEIVQLRGMLPICSRCKKVRNDQLYWENVETFLAKRTDYRFSHGLCPECFRHMYPEDGASQKK